MGFVTTRDQTKLFYNDAGTGQPVILIHGWPVSSAMWEYQATALLEKGYRVISYDRRGFGKSDQPASGYDYDTFADDLKDVMDTVNVRTAALVGFSMGGGEIARFLSRHGADRVSKTVLISSVLPYMMKTTDNPAGVPETVFEDMKRGLKEDRPHFLSSFAKDFYGVGFISHPVSNEILQWTSYLAYPASAKATLNCVDAFGKTDFRKDIAAFTMPTLIIHGVNDKTVPIDASAKQVAKMLPKAIFKQYEGAAHGLFITHKNQLTEDLFSFL